MQVGYVEAGSRDAAVNILAGHELFVLSIESAEARRWYDPIVNFFGRVRSGDMVVFTRQLATLLEARVPLSASLKTLHEQTGNETLRVAVAQAMEDVDAGLSFSQALERQGTIFPRFYVEMIRVAEITGNLNEVAGFLADYTEREGALSSRATSALIYPSIVIALFAVVAFIMVAFVFPQIGPVFEESGVTLPLYTRLLLGAGEFLGRWWLAILIIVGAVFILFLDYIGTPEGTAFADEAKLRLPVVKKVQVPLVIARFSDAASLLIKGGIPLAQTMEVISQMLGNVLYKDAVQGIASDVRKGELLSESIARRSEYFPPLVSQMVAVGETTGKLEQTFARLAGFYGREVDAILNNLVDLIQPTLMIAVGVLVGLLFASILIPLYSLTASIG